MAHRFCGFTAGAPQVWFGVRKMPFLSPLAPRSLALCLAIPLAVGCRAESAAKLHEMPGFSGAVRITPESGTGSGAAIEVRLAFARSNRNLQVYFRLGGKPVTALPGPNGAVSVFDAGTERPASAEEAARFRLVQALIDPGSVEAQRTAPDGYAVRHKGVWYRVEIEPADPPGAHHKVR